jgi:sec-independent protein translocase protein TatB
VFDVGFSEILVILVVALVVIGPEKLPKVARTLGLLTGRVQRYAASVKAEVERELRNEEILRLERETQQTIGGMAQNLDAGVRSLTEEIQAGITPAQKTDDRP